MFLANLTIEPVVAQRVLVSPTLKSLDSQQNTFCKEKACAQEQVLACEAEFTDEINEDITKSSELERSADLGMLRVPSLKKRFFR